MSLVVTVTPNAALDQTLHVAALEPGTRQRVRRSHVQAGGKGVNVSRVLARLGVPVRSVVVVGGVTGASIERDLAESGLVPIGVPAPGDSRTCTEIIDARSGQTTQLHGPGVRGDAGVARHLVETVEAACNGASWLALCGSLAEGLPIDIYALLIERARARGLRVALDTSGAALVAGWRAAPEIVRVNADEVREVAGACSASCHAARLLTVVSDGAGEIMASTPRSRLRIRPPAVRVRNPIGCGDAMLAGLLARIDACGLDDTLRFATALASADAESVCAGRPDIARARALEAAVELRSCVAESS
ncbi:MAG: hexose kinase [Kofleriaceae bacterium]|nr:hexose kinase [Kofleriaceae bacterium]